MITRRFVHAVSLLIIGAMGLMGSASAAPTAVAPVSSSTMATTAFAMLLLGETCETHTYKIDLGFFSYEYSTTTCEDDGED